MTMTLKVLLEIKRSLEMEKVELMDRIKANGEMIAEHVAAQTAAVRKLQGKEFGAVNAVVEGIKVTETISKTVKWDDEQMMGVFQTIRDAEDDPFKYMKAKFSVGEKEYAAFMPEIKAVFDVARTVVPGAPSYKFEEAEVG